MRDIPVADPLEDGEIFLFRNKPVVFYKTSIAIEIIWHTCTQSLNPHRIAQPKRTSILLFSTNFLRGLSHAGRNGSPSMFRRESAGPIGD